MFYVIMNYYGWINRGTPLSFLNYLADFRQFLTIHCDHTGGCYESDCDCNWNFIETLFAGCQRTL